MAPPIINHPAKNHASRNGQAIATIVVHHTGGTNSLAWLTDNPDGLSTHVLIDKPGTIYRMVPDGLAANTVGHSNLGLYTVASGDKGNANQVTLNIELENEGNGSDPYPESQRDSCAWQIASWWQQYGDLPVIPHKLIDTNGKTDPRGLDFRDILSRALPTTPHAVTRHGLVLTNTTSLDTLEESMVTGSYNLLKVISAWGVPGGWTQATRARACALTCETIVRTHAGDPSSGKPYPHSEEMAGELDPWYEIKRHNLLIEIGNEPNSDATMDPSGYAWHLARAIAACRSRYPKSQIIAPALDMGRANASTWLNNPDFAAALRSCHMIGVHAYAFFSFDDSQQLAKIQSLYQPFRTKPWALTEYGINDVATSDSTKGQRYAGLVRSLSSPYTLATFYHKDANPSNPNDDQYAIGADGDRAYGLAWRA